MMITLTEQGDINSLAYYCRLRMIFKRTPIIYNFTFSKAANVLGVSKSTAHSIFKRLEALSLISYKDGHCHLLSNTQARKIYHDKNGKTSFTCIKKLKTIDDIKTWIQYSRLLISVKGQIGQIHKKENSFKLHTRKGKKVPKEILNKQSDVILSNKRIGEFFNMSQVSGGRIQKKLNDLKIIVSTSNCEKVLSKVSNKIFNSLDLGNNHYLLNGNVYRRLANKIEIPILCTV